MLFILGHRLQLEVVEKITGSHLKIYLFSAENVESNEYKMAFRHQKTISPVIKYSTSIMHLIE